MRLYHLQDVIDTFGSKANLSRELGLDRSTVTHWGKEIPDSRQVLIMRLMGRQPRWMQLKYNTIRAARIEAEASTETSE